MVDFDYQEFVIPPFPNLGEGAYKHGLDIIGNDETYENIGDPLFECLKWDFKNAGFCPD